MLREEVFLANALPFLLIDPVLRAIGREYYKGHPLIVGLHNRRIIVHHGAARSATQNTGFTAVDGFSEGRKCRCTLVDDHLHLKGWMGTNGQDQRRVARAR